MASKKKKENKKVNAMEEVKEKTGEKLTAEQLKCLKTTFKKIDMDKDGKISEKDLRRACRKLGILLTKDELEEMIGEADDDGNGFIEYEEYERLIGHQLLIANFKNNQLKAQFRKFDKDGDGFITGTEIREVFRESGVELDDTEISELIEEADANGDGVISFEVNQNKEPGDKRQYDKNKDQQLSPDILPPRKDWGYPVH